MALDLMPPVDELICLGDMVEEYRFSNEAIAILRDRGARCVLGNHDIGLLGPHGQRARSAEHVDQNLVSWLAEQPRSIQTVIDGRRVTITHASPCAPGTQYVMPGSPELRRIAEVDADLVLLGHTHRQMVERAGTTLVINPGSAGQARDPGNGRQLSFAVVDVSHSTIEVEIRDYKTTEATLATPA